MITVIYSTHKDKAYNDNFKSNLTRSIGVVDLEILEFQNNNEYSLAEVYNKGIGLSKHNIVVCLHNDVKLESGWGKKLLSDFRNNPDYAIIGKAGACDFPVSGVYWENMNVTMVGQVFHHPPGARKWENRYSAKLPFLIPVITIDGLFISFDKTKIKHLFDETIGKFHFYDHGFCLPNYLDGVKIGVTSSFQITHESVGRPNQEFYESKDVFLKKYEDYLPLHLKPEKIFYEPIAKTKTKNIKKVAVVIPTKGKTDLLFQCIDSYIEHCDHEVFSVFIADTGSSEEDLSKTEQYIIDKSGIIDIKLIKYNYYNFAKINNDVVKNHVSDDFEYLLFSNNDIKLLNNVIQEMLTVFKQQPNAGTVGARLHFGDNTVQHCGIIVAHSFNKRTTYISHKGFKSYYNYDTATKEVIGNTAALMMIRRSIFNILGQFNEEYLSCFEDVELNLNCRLRGLRNYTAGKAVAYHFESQTRQELDEDQKKMNIDYNQRIIPFIQANLDKFIDKIITIQ